MLKPLTFGTSDYDWRAALGLLTVLVGVLLDPQFVGLFPELLVKGAQHVGKLLEILGVVLASQGKPLLRESL